MELIPAKEKTFLKQNIIFILLGAFFCIFGRENQIMLVLGYAIFVTAIICAPMEHKFCWSLFFIPNIRLFDNLGTTVLVNILMILPIAFYFIKKIIIRDSSVSAFPIFGAIFLYLIEIIHMQETGNIGAKVIGWALSFAWCCYATIDKNININKNDVIYSLTAGIVMSAVVYMINDIVANGSFIADIFEGYRFEGYGDDPNYYSLYICLALSGIVIKPKINISDFIVMVLLVSIGLFTASKMFFLIMLVIILYFIFTSAKTLNKFVRSILIVLVSIAIIYMFKDYILYFIDNIMKRAGGKRITLDSFSTGRFSLVMQYIEVLSKNFTTLFFGKGFSYHTRLPVVNAHGAHNTFMDFVLAWGIVGTIILLVIIGMWLKFYRKKLSTVRFTNESKFPFFVLCIGFFALSCFSSNMFFFIIALTFLQLEAEKPASDENNNESYLTN